MIFVNQLIERFPQLQNCKDEIKKTILVIENMHKNGGKLLLAGNGGSCSDCEHISGELLKGFRSKRKPSAEDTKGLESEIADKLQLGISAVPLASLTALSSAFNNDVDPNLTFSQLVFALGKKEDVFMGLSTSGNANNICNAVKVAKSKGLLTIGLTGEKGGELGKLCDITIKVPETETYKVQELHLPTYHAICAQVEYDIFG